MFKNRDTKYMSIGVHLGVIWKSYWYVQMRSSRIQTPSHSYTKESNKRAHSYTWHHKMQTHSYPALLISITINFCLILSTLCPTSLFRCHSGVYTFSGKKLECLEKVNQVGSIVWRLPNKLPPLSFKIVSSVEN